MGEGLGEGVEIRLRLGRARHRGTKEDRQMQEADLEAIAKEYLEAMESRDLARCVDFYAEDGVINFQNGIFKGKKAIEEWHKERFEADLRVTKIEQVKIEGDTVKVDAMTTSSRLRAWKIDELSGTVTLQFEEGKIKEISFALRVYNPLEGW